MRLVNQTLSLVRCLSRKGSYSTSWLSPSRRASLPGCQCLVNHTSRSYTTENTSNLTLKPSISIWTSHTQNRQFWTMLNMVFNRPDQERIKEVGAERACAEWLMRCGAHVKWVNSDRWQTDYNSLPSGNYDKYKIEEVNADDAAVMHVGFVHLDGLTELKSMRFHHCAYLEDEAIMQLVLVKDCLEHLEIGSCGDISNKGLSSLTELKKLKTMLLYDLPGVRDKPGAFKRLQAALPNCTIDFKDLNKSA